MTISINYVAKAKDDFGRNGRIYLLTSKQYF